MPVLARLIPTLLLIASLLMSGCGFHLRNQTAIPYSSVFIEGGGAITTTLRQMITASGHPEKLAKSPGKAERIIDILSEDNQMIIVAITGAGLVSEYQLQYRVKYRLLDSKRKEVLAPTEIMLSRDMNFNATQPYAYGDEEAFLTHDMQTDAAHQILLRIAMLHR